jgi:hypothetical protein
MLPLDALLMVLLALFVFVASATFTAYFLRPLIPWRYERPRFSNAVAYVLAVLLGLMAAIYAISGATSVADANRLAALLYRAVTLLAVGVASLTGGYIVTRVRFFRE